MRREWLVAAAVLLALVGCQTSSLPPCAPAPATSSRAAPAKVRDASDAFFDEHRIPQLKIMLSEEAMQKLREDGRRFVTGKLVEDERTSYPDVAVKLKGAAGSFQGVDDKPAFTIRMGKSHSAQRFHALEKFHLNNSVQDDSLLCEALCGELFREANVPATRATHCRVWLNDRELGVYVLKEGFDVTFLKRHFRDPSGNLYDGGFCQDLDAELERDAGKGVDDRSDLQAIVAACREPEESVRWEKLEKLVDIDALFTFIAVEMMTCHWDGYTSNKNNYRVYFEPPHNKLYLLPHGMDQMFQDAGFPLYPPEAGMLTTVVMQNPVWRTRYRERVEQLLPQFIAEALTKRLDRIDAPLAKKLAEWNLEWHEQHAGAVQGLRERLVARAANLLEQFAQPDPGPAPPPPPLAPLEFNEQGEAELADLYPAKETDDAEHDSQEVEGEVRRMIAVGPSRYCIASWRQRVLLEPGEYQAKALIEVLDVESTENDEKGEGAGIRISGATRDNRLFDTAKQEVEYDFSLDEPREVEIVVELRAISGSMTLHGPVRLKRK